MTTDVMIQASGLTKRFGSVRALDKVNFEVKRGEVVGFLGPNGAGKSTTMRILTCYIAPSSGAAKVHGHDVFDEPLEVRRALGYLPQRAPLYTDMNVWEYLKFVAEIRGLDEGLFKKRLKKVVEVCGLAQSLGKQIGTLSHGYRQRVGLGQALIHDPPILDPRRADERPGPQREGRGAPLHQGNRQRSHHLALDPQPRRGRRGLRASHHREQGARRRRRPAR